MAVDKFGRKVKDKQSVPEVQPSSSRPEERRSRSSTGRETRAARNGAPALPVRNVQSPRPQELPHASRQPTNVGSTPNLPQQGMYQPNPYGHYPSMTTNRIPNQQQQPFYQQPTVSQPHRSYSQPDLPLGNHGAQEPHAGLLHQGAALVDRIQDRMSTMISAMDGNEDDSQAFLDEGPLSHGSGARGLGQEGHRRIWSGQTRNTMSNYFSKVWLYANSRLPPHLPPLKVYIPTYPLLCLAARHSLSAYSDRRSSVALPATSSTNITQIHIPSSLRFGTKAMVLALHTLDTSNTIILAIRGSATFVDWAVNFRPAPDSPAGFLDDPGNLVHNGFLAVAKAMVKPVADRVKGLIQENPDRWKDASLLFTGHSAGGAVASLLYCHLLSQSRTVSSELKDIAGLLRRVHCVTFGAPPTSLLPLEKPTKADGIGMDSTEAKRWKKSMFFSFVNEGDPVVRADRAFVRSLLALYTTPAPASTKPSSMAGSGAAAPVHIWNVPPNSLSNAGRLVVLRPVPKGPLKKKTRFLGLGGESGGNANANANTEERIEAVLTTDEQLRTVIFGDPAVHSMKLYSKRIETLAFNAVTAA